MFKISIPKPCFEGWDNMTPNEMGRFCSACAKTVVDFSVMSDEAVQQYFINHHDQKICGRFKNVQLQRIIIELPQNIFRIKLPFWKRFLVAFLICFGGTFLAIGTTMAGTTFFQGDTIYQQIKNPQLTNKKNTITKKNKRRKKDHLYTLNMDLVTLGIISRVNPMPIIEGQTRSGYCVINKEPDLDFPFNEYPLYANITENTQTDIGTSVKNNSNADSKKEKPKSQMPDSGSAFILPAVLALRNPFSKKKKVCT